MRIVQHSLTGTSITCSRNGSPMIDCSRVHGNTKAEESITSPLFSPCSCSLRPACFVPVPSPIVRHIAGNNNPASYQRCISVCVIPSSISLRDTPRTFRTPDTQDMDKLPVELLSQIFSGPRHLWQHSSIPPREQDLRICWSRAQTLYCTQRIRIRRPIKKSQSTSQPASPHVCNDSYIQL